MSESLTREFVGITDEGIDSLRRRIGVKIEDTIEPWCYEATRDNIRHYAHGIGDDNPLWCDPNYAKKTRYGDVIAPPSFILACDRIISGYVGGLPGVHAMWAGADWIWRRTVKRNDEITTKSHLKELISHQTRFAGRAIQQIYHVDFFNQNGEMVAEADSWCFRTERDHAREQGSKYADVKSRPTRRYTDEELAEVFSDADLHRVAPGVWNRREDEGPTVVIQMVEEVLPHPDVRRFTLHWGLTLPSVPFCRHGSGPNTRSTVAGFIVPAPTSVLNG